MEIWNVCCVQAKPGGWQQLTSCTNVRVSGAERTTTQLIHCTGQFLHLAYAASALPSPLQTSGLFGKGGRGVFSSSASSLALASAEELSFQNHGKEVETVLIFKKILEMYMCVCA